MGLAFRTTRQFEKDIKRLSKRYRLLFEDLEPVLDSIKAGQCIGTLLTEISRLNAFKVRIANTSINKGKSGGFRLIYAHFEGDQCNAAIALTLYCKQDVAAISSKELVSLISEAQDILASMDPSVFEGEGFHPRP